jgi:hypothetical protein
MKFILHMLPLLLRPSPHRAEGLDPVEHDVNHGGLADRVPVHVVLAAEVARDGVALHEVEAVVHQARALRERVLVVVWGER